MTTIPESIMLICFAVAMLLSAEDKRKGKTTDALLQICMSLAGVISSCLNGLSLVSALIVKGKVAHD